MFTQFDEYAYFSDWVGENPPSRRVLGPHLGMFLGDDLVGDDTDISYPGFGVGIIWQKTMKFDGFFGASF